MLYFGINGFPLPQDSHSLFPDRYLGGAVENALGKDISEITVEDCLGITELDLSREGTDYFKNLEGIQYFEDLESLTAVGGNIDDISALSKLKKLKYLDLKFNDIEDITPLKDIPSLEIVILNDNEISDISPLIDLPNLQEVNVRNNRIFDNNEFSSRENVIFEWR